MFVSLFFFAGFCWLQFVMRIYQRQFCQEELLCQLIKAMHGISIMILTRYSGKHQIVHSHIGHGNQA